MKFLGVLIISVLASGPVFPKAGVVLGGSPPTTHPAQAARTPVLHHEGRWALVLVFPGLTKNQFPPVAITGFTSWDVCVGAGEELQARFNSDGYSTDFGCVWQGK